MTRTRPGEDDEADRRLARSELERLDDYEAALRHAEHLRGAGLEHLSSLRRELEEVEARRHRLVTQAGGHLSPRSRPKQAWTRWSAERPLAIVSVDETGLTKGDDPKFPFFAVAAVIVRHEDMPSVHERLRAWQSDWLGSETYLHELDARKGTGKFHFSGDEQRRARASAARAELLATLPYTVTAVVIDKVALRNLHPTGQIDGYLPARLYPLALQMLFERVVHSLYGMGDRLGLVEAEGIGATEDAVFQQAFVALRLRGTRFLSERWFRYQLADSVQFFAKSHNACGLQLADWVVKPCADAVATVSDSAAGEPRRGHPLWDIVSEHLYDGFQGRPDTFGLKVYPGLSLESRRLLFPTAALEEEADWSPEKLKGPAA